SLDAQDESGEVLPNLFARPALMEAQSRIKQLSERNLRAQLRLLRQALEALRPPDASISPTCPTSAALATTMPAFDAVAAQSAAQTLALQIGEHLLAQAMGQRDFACYFQLEARNHPALRPYPLRPELSDGLAGLALFFGELSCSPIPPKQQARFGAETSRIVATVQRSYADFGLRPASCGAFAGLSGWIFTLARLSLCMRQPQWLQLACNWLEKLPPLIVQDRHFDVVQGCAGDLLVLLHLQQLAPDSGALAIAASCAAHLRQHAICDSAGARWIDDQSGNGFAHAGIVLALAHYAGQSGDDGYDDVISAALVWLCQQCHDKPVDMVGPDCGWQHGMAGRGLALLNLPPRWHTAQTRAALDNCLATTLAQGGTAKHDVAEGNMGALEFLQQAATDANGSASPAAAGWQNLAAQLLAQTATQIAASIGQPGNGPDLLGYLHGWSGIGHGLLRLADPQHVAALLTLALHQSSASV
ncbi:MAG: type 2 lantibiotic biosynthesis LanM family protein, partial [Pseudomonadota bacterium]